VRYELLADLNDLRITITATTDKATPGAALASSCWRCAAPGRLPLPVAAP
jgi:hypothetical protein